MYMPCETTYQQVHCCRGVFTVTHSMLTSTHSDEITASQHDMAVRRGPGNLVYKSGYGFVLDMSVFKIRATEDV